MRVQKRDYRALWITLLLLAIFAAALYVCRYVGQISEENKGIRLMDFESCSYEEEKDDIGHIIRRYYVRAENGEQLCVGESFGFEIDDYIIDLDCDGVTELVCNCTFGADGVHRVYIYRLRNGTVERGTLVRDKAQMPGFIDWGANAAQEFYDIDRGNILLRYYAEDGIQETRLHYADFRFEPFASTQKAEITVQICAI